MTDYSKQIAVVGGTAGIGRAIARYFAARGAKVIVLGRTFRDQGTRGIEFLQADLELMSEARRVAKALPAETLDLVVFTTGTFPARHREETQEGIERDMAVSYLSRLVILNGIASRLGRDRSKGQSRPRVFIMGMPGSSQTGDIDDLNSEKSYGVMRAHSNTVGGNEALVYEGAERYPYLGVFGLAPGIIKTGIRGHAFGSHSPLWHLMEWLIGLFTPSADDYAKNIGPLLVSPELEGRTGECFNRKGKLIQRSTKLTPSYVQAYIAASEALVAIKSPA
jgi:NAD(P)-dependent dehydrogenase (short-subunit alcohol dehydrogenase family)